MTAASRSANGSYILDRLADRYRARPSRDLVGFKKSHHLTILSSLKPWAHAIKREVVALWLAARDPRVPWYAKATAAAVAAYALSPIDLIPDFIPVIGYLDDLVILPLGILLTVKLVPAHLMDEFRAEALRRSKPTSRAGSAFNIAIWLAAAAGLAWLLWSNRST